MLKFWRMDDWEPFFEQDSVKAFRRTTPDSTWQMLRGDGRIEVPVSVLQSVFSQYDRRGEWDKMFDHGDVIEQWGEGEVLLRMQYKPVWPTTARDFLNRKWHAGSGFF
jgi:hypothetical protein